MEQTSSMKRTELNMARSMCWHCQSEVTGEYFCDRCVKVQPLSKDSDYFTCLGLPRQLSIDADALEKRFYEMSRAFHPDFFQVKTDAERSISLANSALLNTAYRTLKDPIQRAEYLVGLESGSVKDIRSTPPADLFEEILSLQEDLEEYRSAVADGSHEELGSLRTKLESDKRSLEQRQRDIEAQLGTLFARWDALARATAGSEVTQEGKQAVIKDLRELLSHRTYVRNIVNDLTATLEAA